MRTISKSSKKYNQQRALIVRTLSDKFQVTDTYIRQAIRGDAKSDTAEKINKEFNRLSRKVADALK